MRRRYNNKSQACYLFGRSITRLQALLLNFVVPMSFLAATNPLKYWLCPVVRNGEIRSHSRDFGGPHLIPSYVRLCGDRRKTVSTLCLVDPISLGVSGAVSRTPNRRTRTRAQPRQRVWPVFRKDERWDERSGSRAKWCGAWSPAQERKRTRIRRCRASTCA